MIIVYVKKKVAFEVCEDDDSHLKPSFCMQYNNICKCI